MCTTMMMAESEERSVLNTVKHLPCMKTGVVNIWQHIRIDRFGIRELSFSQMLSPKSWKSLIKRSQVPTGGNITYICDPYDNDSDSFCDQVLIMIYF